MHLKVRLHSIIFSLGFLFWAGAFSIHGQQAAPAIGAAISAAAQAEDLPDAPQPQIEVADAQSAQTSAAPQSDSQQTSAGQSGSSSPAQTQQPGAAQSEKEKAEQELKDEEKQRVLGIVPNFNLTYLHNAVPLSAGQKINLAFHSSVDPFTFAAAFLVAGYHEALDEDSGFGWGAEGYFKRSGAAYLDAVDGTMIGNGFLPALLRQDPRYFRLGYGTVTHRILYAAMTNFVCKGDSGHWQPNISNVGGNIIAGALSNLYYPSQNSGWGQTISNGMIVTTEGAFGSLFDEFWPDISRKFLHKDPTHGLDAQQAAEENRKKNGNSGSDSDKPIQK